MNSINLNGPTGGTFTLSEPGRTTEPIRFDASIKEVNAALAKAEIPISFAEHNQNPTEPGYYWVRDLEITKVRPPEESFYAEAQVVQVDRSPTNGELDVLFIGIGDDRAIPLGNVRGQWSEKIVNPFH